MKLTTKHDLSTWPSLVDVWQHDDEILASIRFIYIQTRQLRRSFSSSIFDNNPCINLTEIYRNIFNMLLFMFICLQLNSREKCGHQELFLA